MIEGIFDEKSEKINYSMIADEVRQLPLRWCLIFEARMKFRAFQSEWKKITNEHSEHISMLKSSIDAFYLWDNMFLTFNQKYSLNNIHWICVYV